MPVRDSDNVTQKILRALAMRESPIIQTYHEAKKIGTAIGGLVLLGGFIMFASGLSGSVEWILETGGLKARMANASPGAIFSLIGLLLLVKYRPKLKISVEILVEKQYKPETSQYFRESTSVKAHTSASSPISSR